jgi:S-adenosylmethionine hydrolase
VHIDKFGNLITDIPADWIDEHWVFRIGELWVGPLKSSYSDVDIGGLVAVIGSADTLEIAARGAAASQEIGAARGDPVIGTRSSG